MAKHKVNVIPQLRFGSGRSGLLNVSVGKRGRVVVKGDASFSLPEMQALVSQLSWFLAQVQATTGTVAAPANGIENTPPILVPPFVNTLPLPWGDDAPNVGGLRNANTPTGIIS